METISLKRVSRKGFNAILRALYEITGNEYYLLPDCNRTVDFNLIVDFWYEKKELQRLINEGAICKHSFLCNGKKVPFIINYLEF